MCVQPPYKGLHARTHAHDPTQHNRNVNQILDKHIYFVVKWIWKDKYKVKESGKMDLER